MHILEIPSFFPPYGGEFCIEQSKALTIMGHEVRIMANVQLSIKKSYKDFFFAHTNSETTSYEGITVVRREMRGFPKCVRPNVKRWIKGIISMFNDYINEYGKPDIIHAHCAKWAGYTALLIKEQYNIPYIITEHLSSGILDMEFKNNNKTWQIELLRQAYYNSNMVVPVSEELVDDISFYYGKNYKWKAISNTIDTNFFHYKKRLSLDNRPFKFCCLANFEPIKGYDVLLSAFNQYYKKYPKTELYIAGKDTNSIELKKMSEQYICSKKIKILGLLNKDEVRKLLYNCDCLILATRSEAQGLVLLEAMSTGIPVITTNIVPKNVYIKDGCFICPVDDIKSFSKMMCHVRENYENIDGRQLSEEVTRIASLQAVGEKLDRLLSGIVNGKAM